MTVEVSDLCNFESFRKITTLSGLGGGGTNSSFQEDRVGFVPIGI